MLGVLERVLLAGRDEFLDERGVVRQRALSEKSRALPPQEREHVDERVGAHEGREVRFQRLGCDEVGVGHGGPRHRAEHFGALVGKGNAQQARDDLCVVEQAELARLQPTGSDGAVAGALVEDGADVGRVHLVGQQQHEVRHRDAGRRLGERELPDVDAPVKQCAQKRRAIVMT